MSKIFESMRLAMGFGLTGSEIYNRAFEQGVLMKDFTKAADLFDEAAKRASAEGNAELAAHAVANSLLYSYLTKKKALLLERLVKALGGLYEIERIGLQRETMLAAPLCAELECRRIEALIAQTHDDVVRLRDLHKIATRRFQVMFQQALITYEYVKSGVGHDERADARYYYHQGMYQFYEAMTKKDRDPATAADDLALAQQAFRRCNDANWMRKVAHLLALSSRSAGLRVALFDVSRHCDALHKAPARVAQSGCISRAIGWHESRRLHAMWIDDYVQGGGRSREGAQGVDR